MSKDSPITIVQPRADGSIPLPSKEDALARTAEAEILENRVEALQEQMGHLQALLAKPLNEILGDHHKALEVAAAWDAFGAMWVLSQRAMRRVALDLAAPQGVSEAEVVARAMQYANEVLNGDGEDLGGSIAATQLAHIARHKPYLRKQFRQG